jgi:hypothetical protein
MGHEPRGQEETDSKSKAVQGAEKASDSAILMQKINDHIVRGTLIVRGDGIII